MTNSENRHRIALVKKDALIRKLTKDLDRAEDRLTEIRFWAQEAYTKLATRNPNSEEREWLDKIFPILFEGAAVVYDDHDKDVSL